MFSRVVDAPSSSVSLLYYPLASDEVRPHRRTLCLCCPPWLTKNDQRWLNWGRISPCVCLCQSMPIRWAGPIIRQSVSIQCGHSDATESERKRNQEFRNIANSAHFSSLSLSPVGIEKPRIVSRLLFYLPPIEDLQNAAARPHTTLLNPKEQGYTEFEFIAPSSRSLFARWFSDLSLSLSPLFLSIQSWPTSAEASF